MTIEKPPADLKFTYEVLNETLVAEEMATSLSELLHKHMEALEVSGVLHDNTLTFFSFTGYMYLLL